MSADRLSELIVRTGVGNRQAFRTLYAESSAKLFAVCLRVLRDRAEAEDALQEVYVKVWQNAAKFTASEYSAFGWLAAIARHHAIDRLRARRPEAVEIETVPDLADETPSPEDQLFRKADARDIERCLSQLKADRADAVRSAYVEGYSYHELAERYRLPINTVRTWLRRSLLSLRDCLAR